MVDLDPKKAFDKVPYYRLILKFIRYGGIFRIAKMGGNFLEGQRGQQNVRYYIEKKI